MHVELGASTAEFGGWDMPIKYPLGIMKEHLHCRAHAGLFDVSHMVPIKITGKDRAKFIEKVTIVDFQALPEGLGSLSMIPNESGGIIDDCIVTNAGDHIYMVINAGHEDKDIPHIEKYMAEFDGEVALEKVDCGLLALQGPDAAKVLAKFAGDEVTKMGFMTGKPVDVAGVPCFVTRSGYTGEDGYELGIPIDEVQTLAKKLLNEPEVEIIGLGARDSLRLEAGLCLYGNDIDDTTSPSEANLLWTLSKRRRAEAGFVGSERILGEIADKKLVKRKRVGFVGSGPPPRSHDKIYTPEGEEVGVVTSGVYGPSLKKPVGMAYVRKKYMKAGTKLQAEVRGKMRDIEIQKMPFIEPGYYRG
eukprot:CAMPEP_0184486694 /NCGR_PEP_ID=MMETSP0113_2-20130426/8319_1 /TAXON_ID=91329 /ORGANISM="Norrisiella sphaerica, Strain BC52" /LENGTH=359 /DNA_ID=CAMNT_0026868691 /DNA_START=253 /DNA_END=1332 /DNA_ORIENTATION=-